MTSNDNKNDEPENLGYAPDELWQGIGACFIGADPTAPCLAGIQKDRRSGSEDAESDHCVGR